MQTESNSLPQHIAIIMDGNGRWAERRRLPRMAGHKAGVKAIEKVLKAVMEKKIRILTLFAFGIENWGRPAAEVNSLMELFIQNLETQAEHFIKNNIRLRVIGDSARIDTVLLDKIHAIQASTEHHSGLTLVIAFNYSGRWDIVQAVQKLCTRVEQQQCVAADISYEQVQSALSLADLPDPDLFIRTSGEQRISNFLLWQLAYTELYFTETLWPDFDADSLDEALRVYSSRQRRYGLTRQQIAAPNQG